MAHISEVQIDTEQLSYALEHDNRFCINFFIPDEITPETPVPDFHVDILGDMTTTQHDYYCCAIPRDHAKTTLAKIAAIKYWLFTKFRFIIYISNTSSVATEAVNDIIGYLKSDNFSIYHRNIAHRDIQWLVERTGEGFYKFIIFPGTAREKTCIIKSLGAGKQVRGLNVDNQRPELAIVDDLETNEKLDEDLGYEKLKRWFYGSFLKAMDKFGHKIIQLGNMTSYKCLIRDHTESKFWHSVRYGAIRANGEPLWKEAWSITKLKMDFDKYREQGMLDIWFAEMMNMPLAEGMGLIKADEIYYRAPVLPQDCEFTCITVDPAISTRSWGHRTGIAVHGYVDECWQLVDTYTEQGMDPLKLIDKVMALAYYWKTNVVGIESVAYQSALKYFFQHVCLERHIEGMEFVDLFAADQKPARFAAYCALIKAKQWCLSDNDILVTQQMLQFDPRKKTNDCDSLDAAAYGPQMTTRYMGKIMNTFRGGAEMGLNLIPIEEFAEF